MQGLENAIQKLLSEAESGNTDFCVTLQAKAKPSAWIQLTWDSLNIAYPYRSDPSVTLANLGVALPEATELLVFEPDLFATFEHGSDDVAGLARFARQYFPAAFQVTATSEALELREEQL